MSWNRRWLAFDTETTGVDGSARIIEIAAVLFEDGEVVEIWEQLLCPKDIDWGHVDVQRALAVNKIKVEDLDGKPTFEQIANELLDKFAAQMVWVAHNADFDLRMIRQELARLGDHPLPDSLVFDTMVLDHRIHRTPITKGAHVLSSVAARWDITFEESHRASADATVCGKIFRQMVRKEALPPTAEHAQSFQKEAAIGWKSATPKRQRRW